MRSLHLRNLLLWIGFSTAAACGNLNAAGDPWPFFAFQNALADEAHSTPASQVGLAKRLGYAGIGSVYPRDVAAFADACDREGLRLFNVYVVLPIDGAPALDETLSTQLAPLRGRQALLWVGLTSQQHRPGAATGEPEALATLRRVLALAESVGATVAIYPHAGFWVERTDHAVRLAQRLNRPELGVSFNLCHFLKIDAEAQLETVLREAGPWLRVVSLNGAESHRPDGTWQELIQPLNRGTFDNLSLLRILRAMGFAGPIGFQGYGIGGSVERNLGTTMAAWRELNAWLDLESSDQAARLRFRAEPDGGFSFNTGLLQGRLRGGARSLGLTQLEHLPSRTRLHGSYGLLSHYRVFTRGVRYGDGAWDWPSTAALQSDGSVTVEWAPAADRSFHLRANYRWRAAGQLELRTTVEALQRLEAFEVFVASYFDAAFTNAWAGVHRNNEAATWVRLDPAMGEWLLFPRDAAAREVVEDGRWQLEPHPVSWVMPAEWARPEATLLRHAPNSGVTVALAAPRSCFAMATPHELEGHYSGYFSLFGHDLQPGETAAALVRLSLIRPGKPLHPEWGRVP